MWIREGEFVLTPDPKGQVQVGNVKICDFMVTPPCCSECRWHSSLIMETVIALSCSVPLHMVTYRSIPSPYTSQFTPGVWEVFHVLMRNPASPCVSSAFTVFVL